jgi:putative aldouronate transport system substrate-binding protein
MATVLGEDGNYHQEGLINFWGTTIFKPDIDEEKFERYMDILDYNCTAEGMLQTNIGFKDIDWAYDAKGEYKLFPSAEQAASGTAGKYPSLGSHSVGVSILSDDFAFDNPNYTKASRMLSKQLYAERCKIATPDTFTKVDWDLYCYDSPNMRKASFDYNTELANLVTMEGDIETNWRKWIESKKPIVQPVLDELNAELAE